MIFAILMNENNNIQLIECNYGHHTIDISNFTQAGLTGPYKICKDCNKQRTNKWRIKNKQKYNEKQREVKRKNKKLKEQQKIQENESDEFKK